MRIVATNRKAFHDYEVLEKLEAGIVLVGTEVKSAREGRLSLKESYARIEDGEVLLIGMFIGEYPPAGKRQHKPQRTRKLLLHRKEIERLERKVQEKGITLVPLSVYFDNRGMMKVEIGLCRGRKRFDKRERIKKREARRLLSSAKRNFSRKK